MEQVLIAADRDRGEQHRRAETQPQPRAALVRARSEQHAGKEKLELQGQEGRHRLIEARRTGEQRNRPPAARRDTPRSEPDERSEERRAGKEWVGLLRSGWEPYQTIKK